MVTYRIVTDGVAFRVEVLQGEKWEVLTVEPWQSSKYFDSLVEAEKWAIKMLGESAVRYREWRVV
jgi:hypothetical protein